MATQTASHDDKGNKEPDPNRLMKCPNCGQYVHFSELGPYQPQEYPKAMYKEKPPEPPPDKAQPEPEVETIVVDGPDEEKKKAGEGWSDKPPEPKAKEAAKGTDGPHHSVFGGGHHAEEPKKK